MSDDLKPFSPKDQPDWIRNAKAPQQDAPTDADLQQAWYDAVGGTFVPEDVLAFGRMVASRYAPAQDAEREDAERYRAIRDLLESAVGGGLEVNDGRLVYEEPEPGKAVRLYWYPDTPVGFYDIQGATLDDVADAARAQRADKETS